MLTIEWLIRLRARKLDRVLCMHGAYDSDLNRTDWGKNRLDFISIDFYCALNVKPIEKGITEEKNRLFV